MAAGDGTASQSLSAPRIKDIALLKGHALMIHLNGDNYSDTPKPLGGGGDRVACGVIPGGAPMAPAAMAPTTPAAPKPAAPAEPMKAPAAPAKTP